jgi:flagellar protein FlgJ
VNSIKPSVANNNSVSSLPSATKELDKRDPRMLEAARAFENQFLRQIVTEMRKTVPKDELIPDSMAENIFKEQLDSEYVNKWVDGGGIGLANMIYDQLNDKYGHVQKLSPKAQGEVLPLKISNHKSLAHDLLTRNDSSLFLMKRLKSGMEIKSSRPLEKNVPLQSPLAGLVLQSAALEDGRQMVVVKHDEGLVTKIVHNGENAVKTGQRVLAGEMLAELVPSQAGVDAKVLFELRKASQSE